MTGKRKLQKARRSLSREFESLRDWRNDFRVRPATRSHVQNMEIRSLRSQEGSQNGNKSKLEKASIAKSKFSSPKKGKHPRKVSLTSQELKLRKGTKRVRKLQCLSVCLDGEEFKLGDHVYVRLGETDEEVLAAPSDSDEECEECRICEEDNEAILIECEQCLGGFHLECLDPPLAVIPDGEWFCPHCKNNPPKAIGNTEAESQTKKSRKRTARERFFDGELGIARIERIWKDSNDCWWFEARWYNKPQETMFAHQFTTRRRELLMTILTEKLEMATIFRHCQVLPPRKYAAALNDGDDVFCCTYQFNCDTKSLRRVFCDDMAESQLPDTNEDSGESSEEDFTVTIDDEKGDDSDMEGNMRTAVDASRKPTGANKRQWKQSAGLGHISGIMRKKKVKLSEFSRAQAALQLSVVPRNLPCRDNERKEIESCVLEAISAGKGRCIYVSGVPGTGKTATVLEVMRELTERAKGGQVPQFQFIHVNGLILPSPYHVYTELYESLTGHHLGAKTALDRLEEAFSGGGTAGGLCALPLVVLVDELDLMLTRNQNVLYNLFDWPTRPNSKLTVIGIANTMDLPERLLPRIASRMGLWRCPFRPYTREQLAQIVEGRLEGVPVFDRQAIKLVAMKVAAVSGDVRRALEMCSRAAQVAEARHSAGSAAGVVELKDVDCAIRDMFEAPHMQSLARCSLFEKVFLVAMLHQGRRTGLPETTLGNLFPAFKLLSQAMDRRHPNFDVFASICARLSLTRVVIAEEGGRHFLQRVQLNIPCDDVVFCLRKDSEVERIHSFLS